MDPNQNQNFKKENIFEAIKYYVVPNNNYVIFFNVHKSQAACFFTKVSKLLTFDLQFSFSPCHDNQWSPRGTGVNKVHIGKISTSTLHVGLPHPLQGIDTLCLTIIFIII